MVSGLGYRQNPAQRATREILAVTVQRVIRAIPATLVRLVQLVQRATREILAVTVQRETREIQAVTVQRETREIPATLVRLVQLALLVAAL
jgi:hypothetical protein